MDRNNEDAAAARMLMEEFAMHLQHNNVEAAIQLVERAAAAESLKAPDGEYLVGLGKCYLGRAPVYFGRDQHTQAVAAARKGT